MDYNTADPLTRWDSYQNICDGEGTVMPNESDEVCAKRSVTVL